jgi:hypothetical protein
MTWLPPIVELRRYRLRRGARETLIALFEREFIHTQAAAGMQVLGQFCDLDDPDCFIWLRGFADMAARAKALQAFYTGPAWMAHRDAANATMINSDNVLLLRSLETEDPADASEKPAANGGLVTVTIASLAPGTAPAFAAFFEHTARPALKQAGARIIATLTTEPSENSFPRLPVREGETVFVWISTFADMQAHARHLEQLVASSQWTGEVEPELQRRIWRDLDVARLVPTARSRLRG